jgi:hypothetical protein
MTRESLSAALSAVWRGVVSMGQKVSERVLNRLLSRLLLALALLASGEVIVTVATPELGCDQPSVTLTFPCDVGAQGLGFRGL